MLIKFFVFLNKSIGGTFTCGTLTLWYLEYRHLDSGTLILSMLILGDIQIWGFMILMFFMLIKFFVFLNVHGWFLYIRYLDVRHLESKQLGHDGVYVYLKYRYLDL